MWLIRALTLKAERLRQALTIQELAQQSGVGERTLRRLEQRDGTTQEANAKAIAQTLGVTAEHLSLQ